MADTIRKQIIDNIGAALADILTSDGYNTDCGQSVKFAEKNIDANSLPAIVVWPGIETVERVHGRLKATLPVRIEGLRKVASYESAYEVVEMILGDVRKRMEAQAADDDVTGSLAEAVYYMSGGIDDYPDPGDEYVNCSATYNIVYKLLAGDPYSQS